MKTPYEILIPDETRHRLAYYEGDLASGAVAPGKRTIRDAGSQKSIKAGVGCCCALHFFST